MAETNFEFMLPLLIKFDHCASVCSFHSIRSTKGEIENWCFSTKTKYFSMWQKLIDNVFSNFEFMLPLLIKPDHCASVCTFHSLRSTKGEIESLLSHENYILFDVAKTDWRVLCLTLRCSSACNSKCKKKILGSNEFANKFCQM